MLPGVLNLEMIAGDGYRHVLTFKDNDDKVIDVSGFSFKSQVRKTYKSNTAVEFTIDTSDAANGNISLSLTGQQVRDIGVGSSKWDLEYTVGNSDPKTIITGNVKVYADVTRET